MKHLGLYVVFLGLALQVNSQETKYISPWSSFEANETAYVFGDNTKLRSKPNTDSEVLELMPIGESVRIIKKLDLTFSYNGMEWPWYEVQYSGRSGYTIGGLLCSEKLDSDQHSFYFNYSRTGQQTFLNCRVRINGKDYHEVIFPMETVVYSVEISDGRGLDGVDKVVFINYLAEACGVNGGGAYVFVEGGKPYHAASITQVSDAGVMWHYETLTFPTDEKGKAGKIIYESEFGQVEDEVTEWYHKSIVTRQLEWKNGRIEPADFQVSVAY